MITTTYTPNPDEKLVPTMVYTNQKVIWGLTLTKKTIRVGTLLQSNAGSKYMNLVDTQILLFGAGQDVRWLKFPLLHIESSQIIAYHTLSPVDESPYYDPDDPHRKMQPVTALVGIFWFDCMVRMAENFDTENFLGVKTGEFLSVYDATMHCSLLPSLKPVQSPFVMLRRDKTIICEP